MALLASGKSVLVSAYTNSAVDNILVKLVEMGAPVLRLGRAETVQPVLQPYTLGSERYPDLSAAGLVKTGREASLVSHVPALYSDNLYVGCPILDVY